MFNAIKNKGGLFLISFIVLFFGFLLYNINSTNQYLVSVLQDGYYQGTELNEYLIERIDNQLGSIIEKKIADNELSAIISFNKSASMIGLFLNVLGVVSAIIFVNIGFLIWASNKDKNESRNILKKTRGIFEEMKEMRAKAKKHLIAQLKHKASADRFSNIRRFSSRIHRVNKKNK